MTLTDVTHEEDKLTLVFELCKSDLKTFIEGYRPAGFMRGTSSSAGSAEFEIPSDIVRDMTYQMLKGMSAMHANRIIHRDLKVCCLMFD